MRMLDKIMRIFAVMVVAIIFKQFFFSAGPLGFFFYSKGPQHITIKILDLH